MKRIHHTSWLFRNMVNALFVQFFMSLRSRLMNKVAQVARLAGVWADLVAAVQNLDDSFKWPATAPETFRLKELDVEREDLLTLLFNSVRDTFKYTVNPEMREAAKAVYFYLENFSEVRSQEYVAETAMVNKLVEYLEVPETAEQVDRIGQSQNVALIKAKNEEFYALYTTRYDAQYAHRLSGSTSRLRDKVVDAYEVFAVGTEGVLATETDPDIIEALADIIESINAEIAQFTIILNRHLAYVAAKKKELEKQKEQEKEKDNEDAQEDGKTDAGAQTENPDGDKPA